MIETKDGGTKVDRYLVFCSEDHQKRFENASKKSRMSYVSDTDDEVYHSAAKDDSDDSADSSASSDEKKPDAELHHDTKEATAAGHVKARLSESFDSSDDDDFIKDRDVPGLTVRSDVANTDSRQHVVAGEKTDKSGNSVSKQKSTSEDESTEAKRRKVESDSDTANGAMIVQLPNI
jgi:hypothetical protein